MSADAEFTRAGTRLVLMPERALWWPEGGSVYVADTHFGKDSVFRAASIPLPVGTTEADLRRLDAVLERSRARRLVVLGDFYHARSGRSDAVNGLLDRWREAHARLELVVIRGNHDLHAGDVPIEWNAQVADGPIQDGPFILSHDAGPHVEGYVLSGHVHPGVRLRDAGGQSMVLPCFRMGSAGAVLPAFGSFTGLHVIRPVADDEIFVIAEDAVHGIPTRKPVSGRRSGLHRPWKPDRPE